ncbi:MAG: dimethylamine methyltransferase [Desulfitibacter sp. BRH_c19]|nr:MAG: dimethylamine methyltransferase [Desulfitibacter sp. BRH_c19]
MIASHSLASGMGGLRTSGDLVARMQMTLGMRIGEAKKHVADKLHVSVAELSDEVIMNEVREDMDIGSVTAPPRKARGIQAQSNIGKLLGIDINSVKRFYEKIR